jgi:hypothetical protein
MQVVLSVPAMEVIMATKTALGLIVLTASSAAFASGIIDFETVPGSTPADQLAISTQYQSQFGVIFSLSDGTTPYLEAVGGTDPGNGFINDQLGVSDTAAPGFEWQLGKFFLRLGTNTLMTAPVPSLIITYTSPVAAASAQIWDIDSQGQGTEQWLLETRGASNLVNDSVLSPLGTNNGPTSLDGKPWNWAFSHSTNDIYSIRISFVGSKNNGIGLAFDNFAPSEISPIPEPHHAVLLMMGLAAIAARKRLQTQDLVT